MGTKIVLIVVAIFAVLSVLGHNDKKAKTSPAAVFEKYDRRNPNHPMQGIYTDSKCSVEEQMKGIYNCP